MYGKKYKPKRKKMKNETAKMYMYAKYTINCWPYLRKEYYNQHYSITTLKKTFASYGIVCLGRSFLLSKFYSSAFRKLSIWNSLPDDVVYYKRLTL